MKSEKEFLESMWTAIEQEQSDIKQEQMVLERNRKAKMRKAIVIGIIAFSIAVAFAVTKIFNISIHVDIVCATSFVIIIIAFVVEKLSFKEVRNGN